MNIEIIVPEVTLATVVADVISVDEDGDSYPDGVETIGDKVAKIIADEAMRRPEYSSLRERVVQIRTEEIRAQLGPIVAEALNGPIRKTNSYGEATSQTTTLREIMMDEFGKMVATTRNGHSRNGDTVADLVAKEVRAQIGGEITKAVKQAHDAALKAIGDLAGAPITEAVKKSLGL